MKLRFLMHDVYGPGGGVLTVVRHLAGELGKRHQVEIVSVLRSRDTPVHDMPPNVEIRPLADVRRTAAVHESEAGRGELSRPSRIIPPQEPHYSRYSEFSDRALAEYLGSVRGGALIGMQSGVNIAIAKLARRSVLRIGQDHVPFALRSAALRAEMKRSFHDLDVFLTLTHTDARRYRKLFGDDVEVDVMQNAAPAYHGPVADHSQQVVTAAGHLVRVKGFDRLIEAWATVHAARPSWELRIFGSGPLEAELQQQIDMSGLGDSVTLMGFSTQLMQELAKSSMFVLSSRFEGFGMVLVEAMSCGLPVISFDCPAGPRDVISDGVTGRLVPNGDIPGLARTIIETIDLGPARRSMGEAAAAAARELSQEAIAGRWEQLISRHRTPGLRRLWPSRTRG